MLSLLFVLFSQSTTEVSMPFIKADVICTNKQNDSDKTLFTLSCLKKMATNYKPTKVYYAIYTSDGKEELIPLGKVTCVYLDKETIFARTELDVKPPKPIKEYVLNAKTYSAKGDFHISSSCVFEIASAEIKYFVLRPKEKAIVFE
jgi:hypothetical protein